MLTALLFMQFLGFPILIQYDEQLQVALRGSPLVTLLCFYSFNLTLHFMVESKGMYSSSESIMGWIYKSANCL